MYQDSLEFPGFIIQIFCVQWTSLSVHGKRYVFIGAQYVLYKK